MGLIWLKISSPVYFCEYDTERCVAQSNISISSEEPYMLKLVSSRKLRSYISGATCAQLYPVGLCFSVQLNMSIAQIEAAGLTSRRFASCSQAVCWQSPSTTANYSYNENLQPTRGYVMARVTQYKGPLQCSFPQACCEFAVAAPCLFTYNCYLTIQ
jgi:hypothetical protein